MRIATATRLGLVAAALLGSTVLAQADSFNRIATFPVLANLPAGGEGATVSEIVAASEDGTLLIYTDALQGAVGFVDITDPAAPQAAGFLDMGGDPTSVKVLGNKALVAVVTSESFTNPSGHLAIVDLATKTIESTIDLGGQPDAVALSPDHSFVAIAIENERDEDFNDALIPQLPGGFLAVLSAANGAVDPASLRTIELTGLAEVAPEDPEVEFVDVNDLNEAVITLQENNHIVVVDLASGTVINHFPAGTVSLDRIDTEDDGRIELAGSFADRPREPDAVQWIDNDRFVTADEGDYEGGTRGFTIFNKDGTVAFEPGASFEHEVVRIGHYPDGRSDAKGIEPEGAAVGVYGDDTLIFIGSERASVVGVFRDTGADPELLQILPAGIGPEGLLPIPERNLFVVANEEDLESDGARAHVMIYQYSDAEAAYPTIWSADDENGLPIAWGALSGLAADATEPGKLYAITDSIYPLAPRILAIDATGDRAIITDAITVTSADMDAETLDLDLEGIAARAEGGFWLASEGAPNDDRANRLIRTTADGVVEEIIPLPDAITAGWTSNGLEGVTVTGSGADEVVWLAIQREWGSDPRDRRKIVSYTPTTGAWGVVYYPTETAPRGTIGLSELTYVGGDTFVVIERDNQIGENAAVKLLTSFSIAGITPAAVDAAPETIPVVPKTILLDVIPLIASYGGYIVDKVEGFAVDTAGNAFLVTDNDGVDDSNGETLFFHLGPMDF